MLDQTGVVQPVGEVDAGANARPRSISGAGAIPVPLLGRRWCIGSTARATTHLDGIPKAGRRSGRLKDRPRFTHASDL